LLSFTPQAKTFGIGWHQNPIIVSRGITRIIESCNSWLGSRGGGHGLSIPATASVRDNIDSASHEFSVLIIGAVKDDAAVSAANASDSPDSKSSRAPDRRLGNMFLRHGWACRYATLENLSKTYSRNEVNKIDCVCFNTSETLTQGMLARLHAAASHLVFVSMSLEHPVTPSLPAPANERLNSKMFDFECTEKDLYDIIPSIAETCVKTKFELFI